MQSSSKIIAGRLREAALQYIYEALGSVPNPRDSHFGNPVPTPNPSVGIIDRVPITSTMDRFDYVLIEEH